MKKRVELLNLCNQDNIVAAEIGVDVGVFSSRMLEAYPNLRLYCVDPWLPYPEIPHDRSKAKKMAYSALSPYDTRCTIIPKTSLEASLLVTKPLHFVYIDGGHDEGNVSADIRIWYPLLKSGGILAGHDFDLVSVSKSVIKFCSILELELHVLCEVGDENGKDEVGSWAHPSWYFWKP